MTTATQSLPPKMLGFWVRMLRETANLSQDALAMASGLTIRTIQRVEAGETASLQTRRSLARGLGYDNPDTFDDPGFVGTVTDLLESMRAAQLKEEEARHPDHIKLEAFPLDTAAAMAGLIGRATAWVFNTDEESGAEAQIAAASLYDNLQDYLDIWVELSHGSRLESHAHLDELLADLTQAGARAFYAVRETRMVGANWVDKTPLPMTIGYVSVLPAEREIGYLMVPKRLSPA